MVKLEQIKNLIKFIKFAEEFDQKRITYKEFKKDQWASNQFVETKGKQGKSYLLGLLPLCFPNLWWKEGIFNSPASKDSSGWRLIADILGVDLFHIDKDAYEITIKFLKKELANMLLEYKINNL